MSEIEKLILYTLELFKVSILVKIDDKLVAINPTILKDLKLETIAEALSNSDLTEEEILKGIELIDKARTSSTKSS